MHGTTEISSANFIPQPRAKESSIELVVRKLNEQLGFKLQATTPERLVAELWIWFENRRSRRGERGGETDYDELVDRMTANSPADDYVDRAMNFSLSFGDRAQEVADRLTSYHRQVAAGDELAALAGVRLRRSNETQFSIADDEDAGDELARLAGAPTRRRSVDDELAECYTTRS